MWVLDIFFDVGLKIYRQTVAEDISYIQSRNRGVQVQTQNQTALLNEIERLLVRNPRPTI